MNSLVSGRQVNWVNFNQGPFVRTLDDDGNTASVTVGIGQKINILIGGSFNLDVHCVTAYIPSGNSMGCTKIMGKSGEFLIFVMIYHEHDILPRIFIKPERGEETYKEITFDSFLYN